MSRRRITPGMRILTQDGPVSSATHEAWWGSAEVLIKPAVVDHPRRVANEFICARLAAALGLPTPFGEVGIDVERRSCWISAVVRLEGGEVAPEDPLIVVASEPDIAAGTLVFDTWIFNEDRHDENIIFHPGLGIWLIDHDQALGGEKIAGTDALSSLAGLPLAYHILDDVELNPNFLRSWGDRVRSVPKSAVQRVMTEAYRRGLVTREGASHLVDFVCERQVNIRQLVRRSVRSEQLQVSLDEEPEGLERGEVE